jgi:hypothetical protein
MSSFIDGTQSDCNLGTNGFDILSTGTDPFQEFKESAILLLPTCTYRSANPPTLGRGDAWLAGPPARTRTSRTCSGVTWRQALDLG